MEQRERIDNVEEALRIAVEGRIANLWTALPGIITQVNLAKMTVQVKPTIQARVRLSDGTYEWVSLPVLLDCPLVFPCGGSFALTLPVAVGDETLVVFASRCIDSWWQSGGVQIPPELRLHSLSDGFAIPGPRSVPNAIPGISSDTVQLRTKDGTAYIELTAGGAVNIVAPGGVNITGAVVASEEGTFNGIEVSQHVHPGVQSGGSDTGLPVG